MQDVFSQIHTTFKEQLQQTTTDLLLPYKELGAPVASAIENGGKQIRPLLFLESIYLWKDRLPTDEEYSIAVAIELLHAFYLIHDDLMDKDDLRRGVPTLHKALEEVNPAHEGEGLALIFGDIIFSKAIELVSQYSEASVRTTLLRLFFEVNSKTAEGQIMECNHSFIPTIEEVLQFYTLKTAYYSVYLPLAAASCIAGKPSTHQAQLLEMSKHIGVAYQLYDDLLEIVGEKQRRVEEGSSDLLRLKMTPLLLEYLDTVSTDEREHYFQLYTLCQEISPEEEKHIRHTLLSSGATDRLQQRIVHYLSQAETLIETTKMDRSLVLQKLIAKYKSIPSC